MQSGLLRRVAVAVAGVALAAGCSSYDGERAPAGTVSDAGASIGHARPAPVPRPTALPAPLPAAAVLHGWDRRRARAWATGDTRALADLYVRRSMAGRADVALLRAYLRRGLTVRGLRMQVFALRVLSHSPRRWRLRVTDRLEHAVAFRAGRTVPLPGDRASTRVVTLVRGADGRWRVAVVRPAGG